MFYLLLGIFAMSAACGFAWLRGGSAERLSAVVIAVTWVFSVSAWRVLALTGAADIRVGRSIVSLISDGALACGFLVLAVRYASWWLGVAMLAQSLGFYFTSHFLSNVEEYATRHALVQYVVRQNCISYFVLALLVGGTLASWRGEVIRRRQEAEEDANSPVRLFSWTLEV